MCFNGDMDTTTHISTLETAIRQQTASLTNAIQTRKDHPTYGFTKASLRQRLARLEGMLFAYKAAVAGDNGAMFDLQASAGAADLGIDIHDLRDRVEAS